jgi:hypothetical protein
VVAGPRPQRLGGGDRDPRALGEAALAEGREHEGAEGVAEDEVGRESERLVDGGDRIAGVGLVLGEGALEEGGGAGGHALTA